METIIVVKIVNIGNNLLTSINLSILFIIIPANTAEIPIEPQYKNAA